MEIESQYRHRKHITVLEVYQEWIVAVANRVKESSYANYRTKFEKHIIPEFGGSTMFHYNICQSKYIH